MISFNELAAQHYSGIWKQIGSNPERTAFLVKGIPMGIASALRLKMADTNATEVSVNLHLLKVSLKCSKRGSSAVFLPSVSLTELGEQVIAKDEVQLSVAETAELTKTVLEDAVLIDSVIQAVGGASLAEDGTWVSAESPDATSTDVAGLSFAENIAEGECATAISAYVGLLIGILAENKECEVEIPMLGVLTLQNKKKKWELKSDMDSAFSSECKNDILGAEMLKVLA